MDSKETVGRVRGSGSRDFEAWLGSLPGSCYANVRQPLVNTMNLAHLSPLLAVSHDAGSHRPIMCFRKEDKNLLYFTSLL